jgi:soluble lytic murein transglycosylase-like protein
VGQGLVRRSVQASAVALGAAIALLPSSAGRHAGPRHATPPAIPRPVDPLAGHVLDRMPSLTIDEASELASTVRVESDAAGLDPILVLAVIGVESGWEPAAVSGRGARGLMQLRRLALETEERRAGLPPGDAHDPVHNVRMGIRYLARMVEDFGDVDLALVAYNAGPTRALSLLVSVEEVPESAWGYARKVRREERRIRREHLRAEAVLADAAR